MYFVGVGIDSMRTHTHRCACNGVLLGFECMNVCLSVCAVSHVLLKDVCNQGSLTDIPSNFIPCNAVISVNRKILLPWG